MLAYTYVGRGELRLLEKPKPTLLEDRDAIVRVTLSSICTSDLHIKHGSVPRAVPGITLGHEMVGIVEEVGSAVTRIKPGDRVAVNVETFCGDCFFCRHGWVNNCVHPQGGWALGCRIDGGQAPYVRVPLADQGLTPIPAGVSDAQALFVGDILATGYWAADITPVGPEDTVLLIGAGPTGVCTIPAGVSDAQALFVGDILATGYWAADITPVGPEDTVLLIGAGPTGVCTLQCLLLQRPKRVIVCERDPRRRAFVEMHYPQVLTTGPEDLPAFVLAHSDHGGADAVIEAAGTEATFRLAWQCARPNAVVTVVALYDGPQVLPLPDMYGKNLTFQTGGVDGCNCAETLDLIAAGKLDTTALITHTYPLRDIAAAYELFEQHGDGVIKVAIDMAL